MLFWCAKPVAIRHSAAVSTSTRLSGGQQSFSQEGEGRGKVPPLPEELQVIKDYCGWGWGGDQSHSSMIQPQKNCPRLKPRPSLRCDLNTQLCLQRHRDKLLFNVSQYMGNGFAILPWAGSSWSPQKVVPMAKNTFAQNLTHPRLSLLPSH